MDNPRRNTNAVPDGAYEVHMALPQSKKKNHPLPRLYANFRGRAARKSRHAGKTPVMIVEYVFEEAELQTGFFVKKTSFLPLSDKKGEFGFTVTLELPFARLGLVVLKNGIAYLEEK